MVLQCLLLLFPAVIFLQSGLDKVFKPEGNKAYIISVFEKTFLNSISGILFYLLLLLEVTCGIMAVAGIFMLALQGDDTLGYYTFIVSVITLSGLLAGQRIAGDYPGAAGIMPYLILPVCIFFRCNQRSSHSPTFSTCWVCGNISTG